MFPVVDKLVESIINSPSGDFKNIDDLKEWSISNDIKMSFLNTFKKNDLANYISQYEVINTHKQELLQFKEGFNKLDIIKTINSLGGWDSMSSVLYQVVTNCKELLYQFDLLKIEATLYDSKGVPISRRDSIYLKFLIYIKSLTKPIECQNVLKMITGSIHIPTKQKIMINWFHKGNLHVVLNSVFSKCNEGFEEEIIYINEE
ncbi:12396_t:CDS:2, partial [Entrophospora sp. SA101]